MIKSKRSALKKRDVELVKEVLNSLSTPRASSGGYSRGGRGVYRASRTNKHNEDWQISRETADEELRFGELEELRHRNRQLIKDSPIAEGTVLTYKNMVVGEGPSIRSDSENDLVQREVNEVIEEFMERPDVTGEKDFSEMCGEAVDQMCQNGDLLVSLPIDKKRRGIKSVISHTEADRVCTPTEKDKSAIIRHGVQYDSFGRVLGYHVRGLSPQESYHQYSSSHGSRACKFFPKEKNGRTTAWLIKRPGLSRPGQSRQTPLLTSCLTLFKDLEDYTEAEIVGARVAACLTAFIRSPNLQDVADILTKSPDGGDALVDGGGAPYSKLQPASIIPLQSGEEIQVVNPNRPSGAFDPFVTKILKLISMKLRIPYQILFLDLSDINFSSYRGGVLEARKNFRAWRTYLKRQYILPIFRTALTEAWLVGRISSKELSVDTLRLNIQWPGWGWVDPDKEAKANARLVATGQTSLQKIHAENGYSTEEIFRQIAKSKRMLIDAHEKENIDYEKLAIINGASQKEAVKK